MHFPASGLCYSLRLGGFLRRGRVHGRGGSRDTDNHSRFEVFGRKSRIGFANIVGTYLVSFSQFVKCFSGLNRMETFFLRTVLLLRNRQCFSGLDTCRGRRVQLEDRFGRHLISAGYGIYRFSLFNGMYESFRLLCTSRQL